MMKYKILIFLGVLVFMVSPLFVSAKYLEKNLEKINAVGENISNEGVSLLVDNNEVVVFKLDLADENNYVTMIKYDDKGNSVEKENTLNFKVNSLEKVIKSKDGYVVIGNSVVDEDMQYGIVMWFDNTGAFVTQRKFNDATLYITFSDIVMANDGYIVVGYSVNPSAGGELQGVLIKYDFSGNIVSRVDKNLAGTTKFLKILEISNNHYVIGGELAGNIILYEYENNKKELNLISKKLNDGIFKDMIYTSDNCFLVISKSNLQNINYIYKIDKDDNIIWQKSIENEELFYENVFEYNNEYYVFAVNQNKLGDVFNYSIIKYDNSGNLVYDELIDRKDNNYIDKFILNKNNFFAFGKEFNEDSTNNWFAKYTILNEYKITINNKSANSTTSKSYVQGEQINLKELLGNYNEISITDEAGNKINFEDGILVMPGCNIIITITTEITQNPHTGNLVSIIVASGGVIGAIGILCYTKRRNKFIK